MRHAGTHDGSSTDTTTALIGSQEEAEAAAKDAANKDQSHPTPKTAAKAPEFDEKAEADYYKLEAKLKLQLGLITEEELAAAGIKLDK